MNENDENKVLNKMMRFGILMISISFSLFLFCCKILFCSGLFSWEGMISILFLPFLSFSVIGITLKLIKIFNGDYIPTDQEINLYIKNKKSE